MVHVTRRRPGLAGLAAAVLLVLAVPAIATAHAELESSSPAAGATVPSPFTGPIEMRFSATLADGSKADLVGPDGTILASATVDGPGATMSIALDGPLPAATYEVKWVSVAEDADLERGTFSFTVAAAPITPSPTATEATLAPTGSTPVAPTASASADASATPPGAAESPSPSPFLGEGGADTSPGDVVIPIVVALIVVGAGAVYLLGRRNRTRPSR